MAMSSKERQERKYTYLAISILILCIAGAVWYGKTSEVSIEATNTEGMQPPANSVAVQNSESQASSSADAPTSATTTWKTQAQVSGEVLTYTNDEYGFQLSYPKEWEKKDTTFDWRGDFNKGLVFSVDFVDPVRERSMLINNCLANRSVGWVNSKPTQKECESVLASLGAGHEKDAGVREDPRDVFVRIYKDDAGISLKQWLVAHYKVQGTELQSYTIGKDIELSGLQGYISLTGCCGSSDQAYVIQKGNYIYEVGTLDRLDASLKSYIESFKLKE